MSPSSCPTTSDSSPVLPPRASDAAQVDEFAASHTMSPSTTETTVSANESGLNDRVDPIKGDEHSPETDGAVGGDDGREGRLPSLEDRAQKDDELPPLEAIEPTEVPTGLDPARCNGLKKVTCDKCGSAQRCTNRAGCQRHIRQTDASEITDRPICTCDKSASVGEAVLSRPMRSVTLRVIPPKAHCTALQKKQFGKGFYTFQELCDPEADHSLELQIVAFVYNLFLTEHGFANETEWRETRRVLRSLLNEDFNLRIIEKKVNRPKGAAVRSFLAKLARGDASDVSFPTILEAKLGALASLGNAVLAAMAQATCEFLRRLDGSSLSDSVRTRLHCITERLAQQMGLPGFDAVAATAA